MKALLRLAVVALAFGATSAFAQSDYGSQVTAGATMAPAAPGDDIRNANSALWGVGG